MRDKGDAHLQELARKQAAQRRTSKRRMLRKRDKREERLRVFRESTVRVGADWTLLEQYTMSQLLALPARGVPGTEDGKECVGAAHPPAPPPHPRPPSTQPPPPQRLVRPPRVL